MPTESITLCILFQGRITHNILQTLDRAATYSADTHSVSSASGNDIKTPTSAEGLLHISTDYGKYTGAKRAEEPGPNRAGE